ncbi:unnamed protein product [Paramecium sonneborni]|uniref:Uncharacterized protein n=1 Tax=Paramecium sonneborni TaxID=65129 RepID=A0A8S1RI46_9CILI|nr:unnamed protein product [Paramecium sonneborni]
MLKFNYIIKNVIQIIENSFQKIIKRISPNSVVIEFKYYFSEYKSINIIYKGEKPFELEEAALYFKIKNYADQMIKSLNEKDQNTIKKLLKSIKPRLYLGNQFDQLLSIQRIKFEIYDYVKIQESSLEIEHGIVYLIILWKIEDITTRGSLDDAFHIFEQNVQWAEKAKIIYKSISGSEIQIIDIARQKKWQKVDHYRQKPDSQENKDFQKIINGKNTPFTIIFNKWGKIVYLKPLKKQDLKKEINEYIQANKDEDFNNNNIS